MISFISSSSISVIFRGALAAMKMQAASACFPANLIHKPMNCAQSFSQ
jgi:hypothetical protein